MEVLYVLIPVAIVLTILASILYAWAVSSGQYDDLDREAESILFDEVSPTDGNNALDGEKLLSKKAQTGQLYQEQLHQEQHGQEELSQRQHRKEPH